jgi:hypothetical protein
MGKVTRSGQTDGESAKTFAPPPGTGGTPHTIASHSDTTATGAELETLTDGSNADALHDHAAGGAPVAARYIVEAADATLTNEFSLGSLATGMLLNTVAAGVGVLTKATGSDLPIHTHTPDAIQAAAGDRLIGRDNVGPGDCTIISLDSTLEFTGGAAIRRAALTGDVTAAAGNNATTIAADAVTYAKMQNVVADNRILGNVSGGGAIVAELTAAQVTTMLSLDNVLTAAAAIDDLEIVIGDGGARGTKKSGVVIDASENVKFTSANPKMLINSGATEVLEFAEFGVPTAWVKLEAGGAQATISAKRASSSAHLRLVGFGPTGAVLLLDAVDTTKVARFAMATIGAGQTRTFTFPDATGTFVLLDATQTLTAKTLTTPTIGDLTNATHNHQNAAGGGTLSLGEAHVDLLAVHTEVTF